MSGVKVFGAALASLTLTALALELPSAGTRDAKRPYEMVWAGRTADEHLLFEDGVLRLRYRATGKKPEVTPDKGIEFRFPKEPGVWDDLAFRIDGGEWRRLAVGGGYPAAVDNGFNLEKDRST